MEKATRGYVIELDDIRSDSHLVFTDITAMISIQCMLVVMHVDGLLAVLVIISGVMSVYISAIVHVLVVELLHHCMH